ncbi:MAG: CBS domain-containing protein [Coriobacteriia bacterium]|nr:CBS domain-containing protein [Coriobacteriia bacterium]
MQSEVYALRESDSVLDALRLFSDKRISGAPVLDEKGGLAGFISDGDIIGALSRQDPTVSFYAVVTDPDKGDFSSKLEALRGITVGQLATKSVVSVDLSARMTDVCTLLSQRHLKKMPVLKDGRVVGVINRSDITGYAVTRYIELGA